MALTPEQARQELARRELRRRQATGTPQIQTAPVNGLPTVQDVLRSGKAYLGQTVQAVAHPIQTLQGLGGIAIGGVQKLLPGTQPQEVYADAVGDFVKQRYGSFEAAKETLKRDPVGLMADASVILTGGAGLVGKVGQVGKIQRLVTAGRVASQVGRAIDPLVATTQAARFAGHVPARILESSQRGMASRTINAMIRPKNRQFAYGKNPGLAIAQEGIVASSLEELSVKAAQRRDVLGRQIGVALSLPAIASQRVNVTKAIAVIDDAITSAQRTPRTNQRVIDRLINTKKDLLGVVVNPDGTESVTRNLVSMTPTEAFQLKQLIGDLTRWGEHVAEDSIVNAALKKSYSVVRGSLEQIVPGIRSLNERWANLLEAANAARDQALTLQRRAPFGILDIVGAGVGGARAELGGAVMGVLLARGARAIVESPYLRTELAKWMLRATPSQVDAFFNRVPGLKQEAIRFGLLSGITEQRVNANTSTTPSP